MRSKIEFADVPGLGMVAATIKYQVQGDGTERDRMLGEARYVSGGHVEEEHRPLLGRVFRAFV